MNETFVKAVRGMREAQKAYFRKKGSLADALEKEKVVDAMLKANEPDEPSLFDPQRIRNMGF